MNHNSDSHPGHFLDSSVLRPLLLATQVYKQYLDLQLGDRPRHISTFVQMEMRRSYLRNIIEFYFILKLPTIPTMGDALALWSNRFQSSKQKAIQQLMAQFLNHGFSNSVFQNKPAALSAIEILIREFETFLQTQFTVINSDLVQCHRGSIVLFENAAVDFLTAIVQFTTAFDQVETCRKTCRIEQAILTDYCAEVKAYVQQATSLPTNTSTRGFLKIAQNLQEILTQGANVLSCKRCERIGDAIIALDAPRNLCLEHTDNAFDYLCPPINQAHQKHPSETIVLGN